MKKINSIKQLKAEKKQQKEQQVILENNIKDNWKDLKESLTFGNIAKDGFRYAANQNFRGQATAKNILKATLSYGTGLLTRQFVNKAGAKLEKLFSK